MTDETDVFGDAPDYARDYLRTFFMGEPTPDEKLLMEFLAGEYAGLDGATSLLEVGCGPVVNHVLSAAPHVPELHMADLRADNLAEVEAWRDGADGAHDWRRFTRFALRAEGREADDAAVEAREREVRAKIRSIRTCDLRQEHPLGEPVSFGAVACFYTTEQASRTRDEWRVVFANLSRLVAPGGRLLCCAIGSTDHYVLYDAAGTALRYPVPELHAVDFAEALVANGFDDEASTVVARPITGQEAEGVHEVILVSARKRSRA